MKPETTILPLTFDTIKTRRSLSRARPVKTALVENWISLCPNVLRIVRIADSDASCHIQTLVQNKLLFASVQSKRQSYSSYKSVHK